MDAKHKGSIVFAGPALKGFFRPCVYAWLQQGQWMYVGVSSRGLSRMARHEHVTPRDWTDEDELRIWYDDHDDMGALCEKEKNLIREMNPAHNRAGLSTPAVREREIKHAPRDRKRYDHKGRMTPAEFKARVEHNQREHFRRHPSERPRVVQYEDIPLPSPQSPSKRKYFKAHKQEC